MAARNPSKVLTNDSLKDKLASLKDDLKAAKKDAKGSESVRKTATKQAAADLLRVGKIAKEVDAVSTKLAAKKAAPALKRVK